MQSARDVDHGESPSESLLLETAEARIVDAVEGAVFEQAKQWFVVRTHDEVTASQREVPRLFQRVGHA